MLGLLAHDMDGDGRLDLVAPLGSQGLVWIARNRPDLPAVSVPPAAPRSLALEQSRPNPMRTSAAISFTLAAAGHTRVRVFDVTGRLVATLLDGEMAAGPHSVQWNGRGPRGRAPDGLYFYALESNRQRITMRLALVR